MPRGGIGMYMTPVRALLALTLFAVAMGAGSARAQEFLNQDWVLNPRLSNVYMQTVKNNAVFETLQFTAVEGNVSKNAEVTVKIELNSIETGTDVRNVRMRFLLFRNLQVSLRRDQRQAGQGEAEGPRDRDAPVLPADIHARHAWSCEGVQDGGVGHAHQRHHRLGLDDRANHRHRGELRLRRGYRQALGIGRRHTHRLGRIDHLRSGVLRRAASSRDSKRRVPPEKSPGPKKPRPPSQRRPARPGSP